jgi:hypothetical protein
MLHDYHNMHSAVGGEVSRTGQHLEGLLPERLQLWLYRWSFDRGHLDTILDRSATEPLMRLSILLARADGIAARRSNLPKEEDTPMSLARTAGQGGV